MSGRDSKGEWRKEGNGRGGTWMKSIRSIVKLGMIEIISIPAMNSISSGENWRCIFWGKDILYILNRLWAGQGPQAGAHMKLQKKIFSNLNSSKHLVLALYPVPLTRSSLHQQIPTICPFLSLSHFHHILSLPLHAFCIPNLYSKWWLFTSSQLHYTNHSP